MSVWYHTMVICELAAEQAKLPDTFRLIRRRFPICRGVTLRRLCVSHGSWVVTTNRRRFQIFHFSHPEGWVVSQHAGRFRWAYRFLLSQLVRKTKAIVVLGAWNAAPFRGLLAPPDSSPATRPGTADDSSAGPAAAGQHALELLCENRLADFGGWLTYLSRPLVEQIGRSKLWAGPFCRVARGPLHGLFIELQHPPVSPSDVGGWTTFQRDPDEQRRYVGVDASWMERHRLDVEE